MSVGEPTRRIHQVESDGDIAGHLVKEGTRVGSAGRLADDLEADDLKDVESRIHDPRKVWKRTAMDLKSSSRWYDYSRARDAMFVATDTTWAPW